MEEAGQDKSKPPSRLEISDPATSKSEGNKQCPCYGNNSGPNKRLNQDLLCKFHAQLQQTKKKNQQLKCNDYVIKKMGGVFYDCPGSLTCPVFGNELCGLRSPFRVAGKERYDHVTGTVLHTERNTQLAHGHVQALLSFTRRAPLSDFIAKEISIALPLRERLWEEKVERLHSHL